MVRESYTIRSVYRSRSPSELIFVADSGLWKTTGILWIFVLVSSAIITRDTCFFASLVAIEILTPLLCRSINRRKYHPAPVEQRARHFYSQAIFEQSKPSKRN